MKQILIIDDEEAICWALQRAFERAGYRVAVAASAEEGLEAAATPRPDAVVLDVRLPGMDGLAALGRLAELTADAPVIVITALTATCTPPCRPSRAGLSTTSPSRSTSPSPRRGRPEP